jgi:RimJ/RimL family protein N-acetyltransferase
MKSTEGSARYRMAHRCADFMSRSFLRAMLSLGACTGKERESDVIPGRVINLRPVAVADLRQLREWEQAPEVARWLTTTASALDARESAEQEYERLLRSPRIKLLAIETKAGDLVGLLRLHDLDLTHRKAQVRLFVAPAQQQRGYGGDALGTVARFCFEELGLRRLGLVVRADHPHAQRLYERLGFRVEGREREAALSEGRWVDFVLMGLLASEWRSQHAADVTAANETANEAATPTGEGE